MLAVEVRVWKGGWSKADGGRGAIERRETSLRAHPVTQRSPWGGREVLSPKRQLSPSAIFPQNARRLTALDVSNTNMGEGRF